VLTDCVLDYLHYKRKHGSRDGSVGIATRYVLEGPGIEFRRGREFPRLSRPAPRPTQPPVQWVPGVSRGKGGRGVVLTTHPVPSAEVYKKSRAIPLLSLRACAAYNRVKPHFTLLQKETQPDVYLKELDWTSSWQWSIIGFCDHGNESSRKIGEYFERLSNKLFT
jgi:hypothetical protein